MVIPLFFGSKDNINSKRKKNISLIFFFNSIHFLKKNYIKILTITNPELNFSSRTEALAEQHHSQSHTHRSSWSLNVSR